MHSLAEAYSYQPLMSIRSRTSAPRVLYCTDTYPPQVNGVSVVTALSVEGLRARGWDCAVAAPSYPDVAQSVDRRRKARSRMMSSGFRASPSPCIPTFDWLRRGTVACSPSCDGSSRTSFTRRPSS